MSSTPTCSTCSSALIDKFDQGKTRWLCPQCDRFALRRDAQRQADRLRLMFVKEEQNFWVGQPDVERIGFEWSDPSLPPSPSNPA